VWFSKSEREGVLGMDGEGNGDGGREVFYSVQII